ncbi:MAG TPA: alanine racemase [Acidimicrobiales bacterium]|nr:alanine racemase [Acidimicrobiales bacterium]
MGTAPNVAGGDVALPALVLKESALGHNIAVMAAYAAQHRFELAPHAKTTMAPDIIRRQLEAGAWGITVANVQQARVAIEAGARRALIANQVVSQPDAAAMAELVGDGERDIYCLVDSVPGVELLEANLGAARALRPIKVLVELGVRGGRAGTRSLDEAVDVAQAVTHCRHLSLAGVEGYEGGLGSDRSGATIAAVDSYLRTLWQLAQRLAGQGVFAGLAPIVSAGGSKYFDRVGALLEQPGRPAGHDIRLVVRAGCYAVHDHGIYAEVSPLSAARHKPGLVPAMEVWAEVLSRPEPGLAIIGLGKRDASFDLGLPVPLRLRRASGAGTADPGDWSLTKLDDQHGYLACGGSAAAPLALGDRIGFGLSHPCTAFDKWSVVLLVDDNYDVLDRYPTRFH